MIESSAPMSADVLLGYLCEKYGHDAAKVVSQVNGWLGRGDGVAVYENHDLASPHAGACRLASFGSPQAQFEADSPPAQMPDMPGRIGWRYRLVGTYRRDVLAVPAIDVMGIPADRNPRRVSYTCAMDNYEPAPRKVEYGSLVEYDALPEDSAGQPRYMRDCSESAIPERAVFIIDDGLIARPYYGGGRHPERNTEILTSFPVNPESKTSPDGRIIDFSTWMLGPQKMYHLKIER